MVTSQLSWPRHLTSGLAWSGALHAGLLATCLAVLARWDSPAQLLTPQRAPNSVQLTASLSSPAHNVQTDVHVPRIAILSSSTDEPQFSQAPALSVQRVSPLLLTSTPAAIAAELPAPREIPQRAQFAPPQQLDQPTVSPTTSSLSRSQLNPSPPEIASRAALPSIPSSENQGVRDVPWQKVFSPSPEYPPDALAARQTGVVKVRVRVSSSGRVIAARLHRSSGVPSLDAAALAAVRRWRFTPSTRANATRQAEFTVPVRFTIEE